MARFGSMLFLVATACWLGTGCFSPSNDASGHCPGPSEGGVEVATAPLFGGSPRAELLQLDPREENAVVALVLDGPVQALCTGVLLSPKLVLTAAHCVAEWPQPPEVRVGHDSNEPEWAGLAARVDAHEFHDVALVLLHHAVPPELASLPLPLDEPVDLVSQQAQLAGFGLTEQNTIGLRLFTDEVVVDDDGELITVDGEGERGACLGDSGGPLLIRDAQGRVRVVGVLSHGSASCVNIDRYVLLHQVKGWIEAGVAASCAP